MNNCLRVKDKTIRNQANKYKVREGNPQKNKKNISMKALKQEEPKFLEKIAIDYLRDHILRGVMEKFKSFLWLS